jgi:hypothetical protein
VGDVNVGGKARLDGEDASADFVDMGPTKRDTTHDADPGPITEAQLAQPAALGGPEVRSNPGDEYGLPDAGVAEGDHQEEA